MEAFLRNVLMSVAGIFLFTLSFTVKANAQSQPIVTTDQTDYPPGATVYIAGSGFEANENVTLQVVHIDGFGDNSAPQHQPWTITADGDGSFMASWYIPEDQDEFGATFKLTADGNGSLLHAETTFTDAVTITVNGANPPPASVSACQGSSITFTSNVTGAIVLTYQWLKDGANISGANAASYTINPITSTDQAGYSVRITTLFGVGAGTSNVINLVVNPAPTASNAGPDQTVCTTTATLAGNNPFSGTGAWTLISGSGTVTTPSSPTSGVTGLGLGNNTFRWRTTLGSCISDDNVVITRVNPPTANAGPDQTLCITSNATLAANTPSVGSGNWSVVSGPNLNSSQFSNTSSPSATFTPAGGAGAYTLQWTITASCGTFTDEVVITFSPTPTVSDAGTNQTVCATTANLAGNAPSVGIGAWTLISGSGTVTTPSSPTSGITGLGLGNNTFRWRITSGACISDDNVVITRVNPPAANAGPDQTLCITSNATLAANTPSIGSGSWSVQSGPNLNTSQFSNVASPTAIFTPAGGAGTYILRWTITASCGTFTDDVNITFSPAPAPSNAGPDQTVCATTATLAGNIPSVGTGAWTLISGSGTATTPSSPTSGVTGLGLGNNTFRWRITSGVCISDDNVIITRVSAPTSNAGPDQTLCISSDAALAANTPTAGTGSWSVVSGPSLNNSQFSNIASPTSTFAPDGGAGAYTLRWTITASCGTFTNDVVITFNAAPTIANAGPDQNICVGTSTALAANTPSAGTGSWSIIGGNGGSISNSSSPTSNFSGVSGNTYYLKWTISNGICVPSEDEVIISFGVAPTAVTALPASATICNGDNLALTGSSVISSPATLLSDNFNSTGTSFTSTGESTGGGTIFTERNSPFNVFLVANWSSPDNSAFMLAYAAALGTANNSSTLTTSPLVNTTGYSTLKLTFNHTYKVGDEFAAATVEVSTDPGNIIWTAVKSYNTNQGSAGAFIADNIDLTPYINQPNFKFRFNYGAEVSLNNSWWAIDDVVLSGTLMPLYSWSASPAGSGLTGDHQIPSNSNSNISVNPIANTTYILTATNPVTQCSANSGSVVVTVNQKSSDPTEATASTNPICSGQSTDLILHGVSNGTGEVIRWYTDAACTQLIPGQSGQGNGFTVNPITTTTYWGRFEDPAPCNYNSPARSITVTVNNAPVITVCQADIDVNNDAGVCGSSQSFGVTVTGTPAPGVVYKIGATEITSPHFFPVGTTTVTVYASNLCATVNCSFDVTVTDNEPPSVTPAANVSVNNDLGNCSAKVILTAPATGDNCAVQTVTNDHPSTTYPVGLTTVIWTVTDIHGNTNTANQTVTVTDNEPPSVIPAANVSVDNDLGYCNAKVTLTAPATGDNCAIQSVTNDHPSTIYPVGTTTVKWTVTDVHGNTNTANQTVTVTDSEPPTVIPAANVLVNNDAGVCRAEVILTAPSTADNCAVQTVTNDHPSTTYPVGTTTVKWTVTDIHGNTNTANQTVTVVDNEAPVVPSIADATAQCSVTVIKPVANDNCTGTVTGTTSDPLEYTAQGDYVIHWTFTDDNGNSSTATQNVKVHDITNPMINCHGGSFTRNANYYDPACSYKVNGTEFDATYSDNCTGATITNNFNNLATLAGAILPNGTTNIEWTVTDAGGNQVKCGVSITVNTNLSVTSTNSNPVTYFGYSGDQSSIYKVVPSFGTAPYKVTFTMNRPLKCNQVNDAGDETWVSGGTNTTTPTACHAFPDSLYGPNPQSVVTAGPYTVTVNLMADATLYAVIEDANHCVKTDSTKIYAEDVRCFAGGKVTNPVKVQLCHKTGSTKNPCVTICVDDDAVAEHLAHGDVYGTCPKTGCGSVAFNNSAVGIAQTLDEASGKLQVKIMPNPSVRGVPFILTAKGNRSEEMEIRVVSMLGQTVYSTRGSINETYRFGSEFRGGVYFVMVMQGEEMRILKIMKQ